MRIAKGVEWAAHACAMLAALPPGWALSAEALAAYHEVPAAYMAKQMQLLRRAGLVTSARGGAGGYALARTPGEIDMLAIFDAIEGRQKAFRCMEIRQNGPCANRPEDCRKPCQIAAAFYAAEGAFRNSLRGVSLGSILVELSGQKRPEDMAVIADWIDENAARAAG